MKLSINTSPVLWTPIPLQVYCQTRSMYSAGSDNVKETVVHLSQLKEEVTLLPEVFWNTQLLLQTQPLVVNFPYAWKLTTVPAANWRPKLIRKGICLLTSPLAFKAYRPPPVGAATSVFVYKIRWVTAPSRPEKRSAWPICSKSIPWAKSPEGWGVIARILSIYTSPDALDEVMPARSMFQNRSTYSAGSARLIVNSVHWPQANSFVASPPPKNSKMLWLYRLVPLVSLP